MDDIAKLLRSRPLYESHGEESDLPEMAADEIDRLRRELSFVARKAGGGLCQMTAEGKHVFLREISMRVEGAGWDVLGNPVETMEARNNGD